MIDYTIGIGSIIEIAIMAGGGIATITTLKTAVNSLKKEFSEMKQATKDDITGIQTEIKKIGDVLITQADQNRRILHLEEDLRELKHGEGFIRGHAGIDREYK